MLVGLDVNTDHFPAIRIMDPNPGKQNVLKYLFSKDNIDAEKIIAFVEEFSAGKILPYRVSEENPMPRSPNILALNANTFNKVVFDKETDVLVFFTGGSRCTLCDEFWPVIISASSVLSKTPGLVFANINMQ